MNRQRLLRGAVLGSLQVVVAGVVYLIYYRYLLEAIGPGALGMWSVVVAATAVGRVADLGVANGLSPFIARALANDDAEAAAGYAETAVVTVLAVVGLTLVLLYPLARAILELVIPAEQMGAALQLLPYAVLAFWVGTIVSIIYGAIDGAQRVDLRHVLLMCSAAMQLAFGIAFVKSFGLVGLALAQLLQNGVALLLAWLVLRRCIPTLHVIPRSWNRRRFGELLRFGWKLQVTTIATLLFEPTTKTLLARFGSLTSTGYYEMASRLIQQVRALVINAQHVLVPAIANAFEARRDRALMLYRESYGFVWFVVPVMLGGSLLLMAAVSRLWIGHVEDQFVTFGNLLALGWFLNILTGPGYFSAIGTGRVRWNVMGHVVTAVLNVAGGLIAGLSFGATGVVAASMIALLMGSFLILWRNHAEQDPTGGPLIPRGAGSLFLVSTTGLTLGLIALHGLQREIGLAGSTAIATAIWLVLIAPSLVTHPVLTRIRWFVS